MLDDVRGLVIGEAGTTFEEFSGESSNVPKDDMRSLVALLGRGKVSSVGAFRFITFSSRFWHCSSVDHCQTTAIS